MIPQTETNQAEYWRWTEANWHDPDIDPRAAKILTCGVDVGSVSSQAVVVADGELFAYSNMRTGSSSPDSADKAFRWAIEGTGLETDEMQCVIGTGYGRVNVPFATNKPITEIACHARGANFMYGPSVRTLLDMGGQDCKIIRCDERGKVKEFLMNDKCAAGTGRFLEVMADALEVGVEELGPLAQQSQHPVAISSTCTVFAESEVIGQMSRGAPKADIVAGIHAAIANRVAGLAGQVGLEETVVMTGGVAQNIGVVRALEKRIGLPIVLPPEPQLVGALGAALLAYVKCET
jgi:bzd-type benzoyl-CoA reductase Q subunit